MLRKTLLLAVTACSALAVCTGIFTDIQAQTPRSTQPSPTQPNPTQPSLPRYRQIDTLSIHSRSGDTPSTYLLTHMLFENASVPTEVADAMGYTERVARAETDFQSGAHTPVHEVDIVRAVNHLMEGVGAPQWARTTQPEVRKLRIHMLVGYPHLIGSKQPPDNKGHRSPVASTMSPVEAAFIATTLVYQKAYNPDYMFTAEELSHQAPADIANRKTEQVQRQAVLEKTFHGQNDSVSLHDLINATNLFFNDLNMPPVSNTGSNPSKAGLSPMTASGGAR
uniref:Uncharacterized protein n=1 Tax=mine drainage metagenome TaxID=410659 RepID=E6QN46_9ZZZZ